MLRSLPRISACILSAACLSIALLAQDSTGRVVGVVTDPQGAVVAGARIVVTNIETGVNRSAVTGSDGQCRPQAWRPSP